MQSSRPALIQKIIEMDEATKENEAKVYEILNNEFKNGNTKLSVVDEFGMSIPMHAAKSTNLYAVKWVYETNNKRQFKHIIKENLLLVDHEGNNALCYAVNHPDLDNSTHNDTLETQEEKATADPDQNQLTPKQIARSRAIVDVLIANGEKPTQWAIGKKGKKHPCIIATKAQNFWFLKAHISAFINSYGHEQMYEEYKQTKPDSSLVLFRIEYHQPLKHNAIPYEYLQTILPTAIQAGPAMVDLWEKNYLPIITKKNLKISHVKHAIKNFEKYTFNDNDLKKILTKPLDEISKSCALLDDFCLNYLLNFSLNDNKGPAIDKIIIEKMRSDLYVNFERACYQGSIATVMLLLKRFNTEFEIDQQTGLPETLKEYQITETISEERTRIKNLLAALYVVKSKNPLAQTMNFSERLEQVHPNDVDYLLQFTTHPVRTKLIADYKAKQQLVFVPTQASAPVLESQAHASQLEGQPDPLNATFALPPYSPDYSLPAPTAPSSIDLVLPENKQNDINSIPVSNSHEPTVLIISDNDEGKQDEPEIKQNNNINETFSSAGLITSLLSNNSNSDSEEDAEKNLPEQKLYNKDSQPNRIITLVSSPRSSQDETPVDSSMLLNDSFKMLKLSARYHARNPQLAASVKRDVFNQLISVFFSKTVAKKFDQIIEEEIAAPKERPGSNLNC